MRQASWSVPKSSTMPDFWPIQKLVSCQIFGPEKLVTKIGESSCRVCYYVSVNLARAVRISGTEASRGGSWSKKKEDAGLVFFLAKRLPSWLPSPENWTVLHDKPFRPVGEKRFSSHVGGFQVSVQKSLGLSLTPCASSESWTGERIALEPNPGSRFSVAARAVSLRTAGSPASRDALKAGGKVSESVFYNLCRQETARAPARAPCGFLFRGRTKPRRWRKDIVLG